MTSRRFEDKTAILTGGAKGIGKATALRYLSEGGRLAVIDQEAPDSSFADALRSEAGQNSQRLAYIQADATDDSDSDFTSGSASDSDAAVSDGMETDDELDGGLAGGSVSSATPVSQQPAPQPPTPTPAPP